MAFNSLKDKVTKLNSEGGVSFMDGREHGGDLPLDITMTLDDYGFIKGENGDYAVISLVESPNHFFFGGSVITDKFKKLDEQLTREEKDQIREEGVPVIFEKRKNKKGKREYTTCTFFPEEAAPDKF